MANISYNRIIRKMVVGFGNLFNNITLVRYNPDGSENERFIIPIAYAAKELYVQRLQGDPNLDKKVQMTLPRMSFEMTGLSYDAARKQNTNWKNFVQTQNGVLAQYNPVPYNFDFSLSIYVRNTEDGTQVIEHILPYFTPDYTIKINLVPEMGTVKEIPVILNDTNYEVTYEGNRDSDPRMIIWTLNFTVKGFIFGQTSTVGLIRTSITNIYESISQKDAINFVMNSQGSGLYKSGELVYQGYSSGTATATGQVLNWSGGVLKLTNIQGNFISSQPIIGTESNANYLFTSYEFATDSQAVQIITVPMATDANANSAYTYTTIINEAPNFNNNIILPTDFAGNTMIQVGIDDLLIEQENDIDLGS
jgi:hypothetical protein